MTRSRFLVFIPALWVSVPSAGCDLDPKGVGGNPSSDTTTGSGGSGGSGGSAGTGSGTEADAADGSTGGSGASGSESVDSEGTAVEDEPDIVHEWNDRVATQVAVVPEGEVVVFGFRLGSLDTTIATLSSDGEAEWGTQDYSVRADQFSALDLEYMALGGGVAPIEDPMARDAFLWLLESGEVSHTNVLAGGSSFTAAVEHGGGTLWTLALEGPVGGEAPRLGVLRRHAPTGEIELTHELLAPAGGLAVDPDGAAYSITAEPRTLHRVMADGSVAWSLALDAPLTGGAVLRPWAEPGVVLVEQVEDEQRIQVFDAAGLVLEEFLVPALELVRGPSAHATTTIVLAHPQPPNALVIEERQLDGTSLWSVSRVVPEASELWVNDVVHHSDGAVVVGQMLVGGEEHGFVRFVPAP